MFCLSASELAHRLGLRAEAVCRSYLGAGKRSGNYWQVGDARNTPGRSLFVRLQAGPGRPAGRWRDAATAEYGDLLDIIRESRGFAKFREAADEARHFLALPEEEHVVDSTGIRSDAAPGDLRGAAARLFASSRPIAGTQAECYLRNRGISVLDDLDALRFHPRCLWRGENSAATMAGPALIAAVTDLHGQLTGVQRCWLAPQGFDETNLGKAPLDPPRKAMGAIHGHAVQLKAPGEVMVVGEGIETVLSLRCALLKMPMAAALSAANLAAFRFPAGLRRLYIARDNDPAGESAAATLEDCAVQQGVAVIVLGPRHDDFNDDLLLRGRDDLCSNLCRQLFPSDAARFLSRPTS